MPQREQNLGHELRMRTESSSSINTKFYATLKIERYEICFFQSCDLFLGPMIVFQVGEQRQGLKSFHQTFFKTLFVFLMEFIFILLPLNELNVSSLSRLL